MTLMAFKTEIDNLMFLAKEGFAPKLYGHIEKDGYGFIIMEKLDCSVKDILLKRLLSYNEKEIVKKMIEKLHTIAVHSDLKPSNIGVKLDKNGKIERACVFDCAKIKKYNSYKNSMTGLEIYNKMKEHSLITYENHTRKNILTRASEFR